MLATLGGSLALLLGLTVLLLPLLVTELSRPRDSVWGAVVLLLGLVLVTTSERLTGAPMLAVLCGGLLVGRLASEVAQGRWLALTDEERQALRSAERWRRSLDQLAAIATSLLQSVAGLLSALSAWQAERRQGRSHGKRWVRSEASGAAAAEPGNSAAASGQAGGVEPPLQAAGDTTPEALPAVEHHPQAPAVAAPGGMAEQPAPQPAPAVTPLAPDAGPVAHQERGAAGPSPEAEEGAIAVSAHADTAGVSTAPPSPDSEPAASSSDQAAEASLAQGSDPGGPGVRVVSDFQEIEALLDAAVPETVAEPVSQSPRPETPSVPLPEG